jgi:ribonuclease Z
MVATLHLLGTGSGLPDPQRTTTMLAVENQQSVLVIDCGGDVVHRLLTCGVDLAKIGGLVVTHEHPDHVAGFPLMMERIWLGGRRDHLDVYGIAPAISQARRIHDAFDTSSWPEYPGINWHEVPLAEDSIVLEDDAWEVRASPGKHTVPITALRIEDRHGGGVMAYSCDTSYTETVVRLATGADILVHEATGQGPGHSSAEDAARVAVEAEAKRLVLVHLPPEPYLDGEEMPLLRQIFSEVEKGVERSRYSF